MHAVPDIALAPAWTAIFMGLFALFAGLGELRKPGHWHKLIGEIVASPALQMVTGLVELFLGAVVYLANPWASPDWLSSTMSVIGGLMVIEALLVIAFSDVYLAFWLRRFGPLSRLWCWSSVVIGAGLIVIGLMHF